MVSDVQVAVGFHKFCTVCAVCCEEVIAFDNNFIISKSHTCTLEIQDTICLVSIHCIITGHIDGNGFFCSIQSCEVKRRGIIDCENSIDDYIITTGTDGIAVFILDNVNIVAAIGKSIEVGNISLIVKFDNCSIFALFPDGKFIITQRKTGLNKCITDAQSIDINNAGTGDFGIRGDLNFRSRDCTVINNDFTIAITIIGAMTDQNSTFCLNFCTVFDFE